VALAPQDSASFVSKLSVTECQCMKAVLLNNAAELFQYILCMDGIVFMHPYLWHIFEIQTPQCPIEWCRYGVSRRNVHPSPGPDSGESVPWMAMLSLVPDRMPRLLLSTTDIPDKVRGLPNSRSLCAIRRI